MARKAPAKGAAPTPPRFDQAMLDRACAEADARAARGSYTAGPRRILQFAIEAALGVRYEGPDRAEK